MPRWDGASDPGPCERRTDGDRITELVPVHEWLSDPNGNQLIRRGPDAEILPGHLQLPRTQYRDHLHDRNRENSVVDTANPGITTYVRVSRRIAQEPGETRDKEDRLIHAREQLRIKALEKEKKLQQEANEILELRSLGIRTAMKKYKDLQDTDQDGGRAHNHEGVSRASMQSAFFM
uniref:Uncharacterized protein n=1 Tax=Haptolina brevifila TaxID=156173 RepID=A0A7S2ITZ4_9EUKA|mmetsp:Transcript_71626/g.142033  ORF Transcript_71626/g.142033 Transcript_71626/m.142033 type:complete len:177 (+) Transcript_71626:26-556(+)|eukprot:CAMPEP_0174714432 /NCGR_PEP_ID=MMETSP1094-20130205/17731_1 /TAXON_ID=156173 /ORGANISM="Chrysochromulina brevifilum, Strain UTEX LB 985" /LENGTH=176 /DNA_ID=CAMNT_0015913779 /DNA_START=19 /DNA_END=549 /DNA_ORIENTATION=+